MVSSRGLKKHDLGSWVAPLRHRVAPRQRGSAAAIGQVPVHHGTVTIVLWIWSDGQYVRPGGGGTLGLQQYLGH